ncbi:MAG: hypothetical protein MZV70_13505 [Desulfobacterales bacterium]|nr:hypothetical protein [Desulfobacterales bacterium]
MLVEVKGIKAFSPASQVDIKVVKDLDPLVGQTMTFRILKMIQQRNTFNQSTGSSSSPGGPSSKRNEARRRRRRSSS